MRRPKKGKKRKVELLNKGEELIEKHKLPEALDNFLKSLKIKCDEDKKDECATLDVSLINKIGSCLIRMGRLKDALFVYNELLKRKPLLERGDFKVNEDEFWYLYYNKAFILSKLELHFQALKYFEKSFLLDYEPRALIAYITTIIQLGNYTKALKKLKLNCEILKEKYFFYYLFLESLILWSLGDYEYAYQKLCEALETSSKDTEKILAKYEMGRLLFECGSFDKAERVLHEMLKNLSDSEHIDNFRDEKMNAYLLLAKIHILKGDYSSARDYITQARKLKPTCLDLHLCSTYINFLHLMKEYGYYYDFISKFGNIFSKQLEIFNNYPKYMDFSIQLFWYLQEIEEETEQDVTLSLEYPSQKYLSEPRLLSEIRDILKTRYPLGLKEIAISWNSLFLHNLKELNCISKIKDCYRLWGVRKGNRKILSEYYYWLAAFAYRVHSLDLAMDYAEKSLSKYKKNQKAKHLLNHIWHHELRPNIWSWWFNSPKYLFRWLKRVSGIIIFLLILLPLIINFIPTVLFTKFNLEKITTMLVTLPTSVIIFYLSFFALLFLLPGIRQLKTPYFELEITELPKRSFTSYMAEIYSVLLNEL